MEEGAPDACESSETYLFSRALKMRAFKAGLNIRIVTQGTRAL